MDSIMAMLPENAVVWVQFALMVIGGAAVAAANLPRPADGSFAWFWKLVDLVAQNYNKSANK